MEPNYVRRFCNLVAMVTAQNVKNWYDLENVPLGYIFEIKKFQLDTS